MRNRFVDEAARNPFRFVLEFVVVVGACQDALKCQGGSDATGINHYPSPPPLFGDVSGGATSAGGVEDEVAGVGGHEETTLDNCIKSGQRRTDFELGHLRVAKDG